jgi:hypothetical protein
MPRRGYKWNPGHRAHWQASVSARGFNDVLEAMDLLDSVRNDVRSDDRDVAAAILARAWAVTEELERRVTRRPPAAPDTRDEDARAQARMRLFVDMVRDQIKDCLERQGHAG